MLSVDSIVRVAVQVLSTVATPDSFNTGLIMTPSTSYTSSKRLRTFNSMSEAVTGLTSLGFTATDPVYKYATKFFGANPAPARLLVSCYPSGTTDVTDETPAQAFESLLERSTNFYGMCIAGVSDASLLKELAEVVEASEKKTMLFLPVQTTVEAAVDENGIMYWAYERGLDRTACMYVAQDEDVAALMGTMCGYVNARQDSSFAMCYRSLTGVAPYALTSSEVDAIKAINGNVYITRGTNNNVLECGNVASGRRMEEVLYVDMIVGELQTALLGLIINSPTKLPQIDSTTALFISECNRVLERYYNRGILATQPWRNAGIRGVANGDIIEHGYVCMADSFNDQSAADREAHKAMPITVLLCMSGSVEHVVIGLYIQE